MVKQQQQKVNYTGPLVKGETRTHFSVVLLIVMAKYQEFAWTA